MKSPTPVHKELQKYQGAEAAKKKQTLTIHDDQPEWT